MSNTAKKTTTARKPAARKAPAKKTTAPRRPADRLPKQNEATPDEAEDITFSHAGQEYVIPAAAFDDIEILELLEDEKNILAVRQLLGPEQWDLWKDRNRGDNGRVSASDVVPFLQAMFQAAGQGNSSTSSAS